jgi:nucleoside-diphosphate-sugar epimerase
VSRSVLVIGGTRNLGHFTAQRFVDRGDRVAIVNRGVTPSDLPPAVERLRADRTRWAELRDALGAREFDVVVDTALYTGTEAADIVELLHGRVGRYVFVSTGQVYLVRVRAQRPFRESDYDGPILPEPDRTSADHEQWAYGVYKRDAEDVFARAWAERQFPFTSLRLPMINSPRDHYERIRNYIARLQDGGPILVPDGAYPGLRHVWVHDVVDLIEALAGGAAGAGRAYNVSQDETVTIDGFLELLARELGVRCRVVRLPRERLERENLLPSCSPFSGRWMSELDNTRSVRELSAKYTPLADVIRDLVADRRAHPDRPQPAGYAQRARELQLA